MIARVIRNRRARVLQPAARGNRCATFDSRPQVGGAASWKQRERATKVTEVGVSRTDARANPLGVRFLKSPRLLARPLAHVLVFNLDAVKCDLRERP